MKKGKIQIYKLKNGDNLSTVASMFEKHPTELLIQNKISPKDFFEGNIIYIKKD